MHSSTTLPNAVLTRTPAVAPREEFADFDAPPTVRVPTAPRPAMPAVTPPPVGDLSFSGSDWSSDDSDFFPAARRAPRIGDVVQGFKLVGELGRGAFARVYLAHQEALADRPVALKVTRRPTREAERLARLQHTNVVPVYSVHADGPVQVICMPYLGRVTIADLLRAYRADSAVASRARRASTVRAGRSTTTASDAGAKSDGRPGAARVPVWTWAADGPPPIVGDPRAVVQVLAQLAAGLAHAHARGILHLDLKPANVLLADTGEPMLLDFNLSFDAARPDRDLVGGTMPYMAVEQLLDMRTRGAGALDPRTDLYALGVMAFEMLTGAVPFPPAPRDLRAIDAMIAARRAGPPPLRPLNPDVSPAVEAIVRKLLAPDPAARYQSADDLRTDLDRHLADLPLKFARDASPRERFGKWRRRNPGFATRVLAAGLIGLALGLGGVVHQRAEATARTGAAEQAHATRAALDATRLDLAMPGDPAARACGTQSATELLAAYGLPNDLDWRKRPDVRLLSEADRVALGGDLGELLFLLSHNKWLEAEAQPAERPTLAAEAWKLNRAARACFPADEVPAVIDRQAAVVAPAAGEAFAAPAPGAAPPAGPRVQFLEAAVALNAGRYATAVEHLDRAVADQPGHAAAQFGLAFGRQQLGQFARALERYDAARALLPADPRPPFQRGMIYIVTKKPALAEAELTKAIDLDPTHAEAYRLRAMARYRIGTSAGLPADAARRKLEEAENDCTLALARGASPLRTYLFRAAIRDRIDPAGATADREAAAKLALAGEMDYLVRGSTRMCAGDAAGALADFRTAADLNPRSLLALQNQAYVLGDRQKKKDPAGALAVIDRAVELYPEFALARALRAVLLARLGRRAEAHQEIEKAQLYSDDGEVSYQAAAVYALTAQNRDDQAKAISYLKDAIRDKFGDIRGAKMKADPDLDPIRMHPDFQGVQDAAETLTR